MARTATSTSWSTFPEGTGLFALQALEGDLRRILKRNVDLAPASSLKPRVREEAEADAIAL